MSSLIVKHEWNRVRNELRQRMQQDMVIDGTSECIQLLHNTRISTKIVDLRMERTYWVKFDRHEEQTRPFGRSAAR